MVLTKVDSGKYTSDERLYLTAKGEVVKEGDPRAASLLVGAGGQLSAEDAEKYGLLAADTGPLDDAPVEKAAKKAKVEEQAEEKPTKKTDKK